VHVHSSHRPRRNPRENAHQMNKSGPSRGSAKKSQLPGKKEYSVSLTGAEMEGGVERGSGPAAPRPRNPFITNKLRDGASGTAGSSPRITGGRSASCPLKRSTGSRW